MQNSTARLLCCAVYTVRTVGVSSEFDADFESVTKIAKNSCEKSYQQKKRQKKGFFDFCLQCCKIFGLKIF